MAIADVRSKVSVRPRVNGPGCAVCVALQAMTPEDATEMRALLADTGVRYTELAAAMREDEDFQLDLHPDTWARHARGNCAARERLR